MGVNHIVMFQFKPDASAQSVKQCCDEVLGLKDQCVLASTGKPYIARSQGGRDMSIEGFSVRGATPPSGRPDTDSRQNGFTHVFVMEFDSVADRDFYVKEDKAHHGFISKWISSADGIVSKAMVVDFVPGSLE
ncbi:stress responsive A/B barrel domain protein [Metarhizium anisopliae]